MTPIYLDLHIHTSEDPDNLNKNYNIDALIIKIEEVSCGFDFLISFTDHNTINEDVYLSAKDKVNHLIIGAELHVRHDKERKPYHCHIYFKTEEISKEKIVEINTILDDIYPTKTITREDDTPLLQEVINKFHAYDFVLLPHAGQNHSTFNDSIPNDASIDNIIEKSVYYNFFDGFTARSNKGRETTDEYFKKLGVNEFINLITCSDNYNPQNYPNTKSPEASSFVPTWMLALPTFEGLRLSLSESTRLVYSEQPPISDTQYIRHIKLQNEKIDIDVGLTPGLNVVIGSSSTGKTLFVDSIYKKIINKVDSSSYPHEFKINDMIIDNPSNSVPHYIEQSFITGVVDTKDQFKKIDDIEIIKKVFPSNREAQKIVDSNLNSFKNDIIELFGCIEKIELAESNIKKVDSLINLISTDKVENNILNDIFISQEDATRITLSDFDYAQYKINLAEIEYYLSNNPLIKHDKNSTAKLLNELNIAYKYSNTAEKINLVIEESKDKVDAIIKKDNKIAFTKQKDFNQLLNYINEYVANYNTFKIKIEQISKYKIEKKTEPIVSMGHSLFIENLLVLNNEKVREAFNHFLLKDFWIDNLDNISPQNLYKEKWNKGKCINDYHDFGRKVGNKFNDQNIVRYNITTKNGVDYYKLSPGLKASVILDLILGYKGDRAPLIIDQPEDNLSSGYINDGLITSIKELKLDKQIIIVSHNATIPMIGDAQNVVLCKNIEGKIIIRSNRLEEKIDGIMVVDHIAKITDGGKSSIKKRLKKYNIKKFND